MATDRDNGIAGYQGYEYQKLVTVWLALKLMFMDRRCDSLDVEPASIEDIAVDLKALDASATLGVSFDHIPLEIQIKSRGRNWNASGFSGVIHQKASTTPAEKKKRGPAPRPRALDHLTQRPELHYLLLTNAQLDPDLKDFQVTAFGAKSKAQTLAGKANAKVNGDTFSRIGIQPELTPERIQLESNALLKRYGHVPESGLSSSHAILMKEVHLRLLGKAPREWPKANIEAAMQSSGGWPPTDSSIVPPTNFAALRTKLDEHHAILLTGGPGLGKTEVARELTRLLRLNDEPFERINGSAGIEAVRTALDAPGVHVFMFEDPWGSDRLAADANFWASELPKLVGRASPQKRFVITSRVGIRHQALGPNNQAGLAASEVELTPSHYPKELRWEMVELKLANATTSQRDWAVRYRTRCLAELTVPLSIDHFCSRIKRAADLGKLKIEEVLYDCAVERLSHTCTQEIKARGREDIAAALALWALHQAREGLSAHAGREIAEMLKTTGYIAAIDPEKTFTWLVQAGWLRGGPDAYVAHPTCLTGIGQLLQDEPAIADGVIQAVLHGLVAQGKVNDAFLVLRHLTTRPTAVTGPARQRIEAFLVEEFLTADLGAGEAMARIVNYSDAKDPVTVLLKALDAKKPMPKELKAFEVWQAEVLTTDQVDEIAGSGDAHKAAGVFVLHVLPGSSSMKYNGEQLVPFFARFGWDFGLHFRVSALHGMSHPGTNLLTDVCITGALLSDSPPFDEMLEACFLAVDAADKEYDKWCKQRRAADQSEWDAGQASHLDDEQMELAEPRVFYLRIIVRLRRKAEGWTWIEAHPRKDDLLNPWAEALGTQTSDIELAALKRLCGPDFLIPYWKGVAGTGKTNLVPDLFADLSTAPIEELEDCAESICHLVTDAQWAALVQGMRALPLARKATIAAATLFRVADSDGRKKALLAALEGAEQTAFLLCQDANPNEPAVSFDPATRDALRLIAAGAKEEIASRAVLVLARQGQAVSDLLPRLRNTDNHRSAVWATLAGMMGPTPVLGRSEMEAALRDPDYRVRRVAMNGMLRYGDASARALIIGMGKDPSAPVREHCAEMIGDQRWAEGEPTLVKLLGDRRDKNPSPGLVEDAGPEFHVARAAAQALNHLPTLTRRTVTAGLRFLAERTPTLDYPRDDFDVHRLVIHALAKSDDARLVSCFQRFLSDNWYIHADRFPGYPLRYAGAWSLLSQLSHFTDRVSLLDIPALVAAAKHDDGSLAGPCLIILAGIAQDFPEPFIQVCNAASMTPNRAALLATHLPDGASEAQAALGAILPSDHPVREFLSVESDKWPAPESAWEGWLLSRTTFAGWLTSIQPTADVNPILRWALGRRFPDEPPAAFASKDMLESLVPRPMKSLTTWSMFHE